MKFRHIITLSLILTGTLCSARDLTPVISHEPGIRTLSGEYVMTIGDFRTGHGAYPETPPARTLVSQYQEQLKLPLPGDRTLQISSRGSGVQITCRAATGRILWESAFVMENAEKMEIEGYSVDGAAITPGGRLNLLLNSYDIKTTFYLLVTCDPDSGELLSVKEIMSSVNTVDNLLTTRGCYFKFKTYSLQYEGDVIQFYDADGELHWEKPIPEGTAVIQEDDSAFILSRPFDYQLLGEPVLLTRLDPAGNTLWEAVVHLPGMMTEGTAYAAAPGRFLFQGRMRPRGSLEEQAFLLELAATGQKLKQPRTIEELQASLSARPGAPLKITGPEGTFTAYLSLSDRSAAQWFRQDETGKYLLLWDKKNPKAVQTYYTSLLCLDEDLKSRWEYKLPASIREALVTDTGYLLSTPHTIHELDEKGQGRTYALKNDNRGRIVPAYRGYLICGNADGKHLYLIKTDQQFRTVWQRIFPDRTDKLSRAHLFPLSGGERITASTEYLMVYTRETKHNTLELRGLRIENDRNPDMARTLVPAHYMDSVRILQTGNGNIFFITGVSNSLIRLYRIFTERTTVYREATVSLKKMRYVRAACETRDGNLLITGQTNRVYQHIFVIKVTPEGDLLWERYYKADDVWSITEAPGGSILIGGESGDLTCLLRLNTDGLLTPRPSCTGTTVTRMRATSYIDYKDMYHPYRSFDGDPATGWLEAADGPGSGETITLWLGAPLTADAIEFMPGYFDEKWWKNNNRVKCLTLKIDGKSFIVNFQDKMQPQKISFPQPMTFSEASFVIKEVFPGKDDDTAISEIAFYHAGDKVELDFDRVKP